MFVLITDVDNQIMYITLYVCVRVEGADSWAQQWYLYQPKSSGIGLSQRMRNTPCACSCLLYYTCDVLRCVLLLWLVVFAVVFLPYQSKLCKHAWELSSVQAPICKYYSSH